MRAADLSWRRLCLDLETLGFRHRGLHVFRRTMITLTRDGARRDVLARCTHNPQTREETLWTDVGEIPNHHIVFSALTHKLALFIRVGRDMVPLEYPAEALLDLTNSLEPAEEEIEPAAAQ